MIKHTATHGLVESFWLQTNVKTSVSSKTVAFFNMRGDLNGDFDDKGRMFIQTTCQCLVLIPDLNGIDVRLSDMSDYILKFKHVIFVFPGQTSSHTRQLFHEFQSMASKTETKIFAVNTQGGANFFDIVCSLAKRLKTILGLYKADSLENKLINFPHLPSDEDEELNRKGKLLADEVFRNIQRDVQRNATGPHTYKPYKLCITPVSAIESKKIANCIKEIEKEKSQDKQNDLFSKKHSIQMNQIDIVTPSLKCFLCKLKEASQHRLLKRFFLGWIQVQLSEETSHIIQRSKEIKSIEQARYLKLKKEQQEDSQELRDQKQRMLQAIEDLENSMFGVDHLFREISHIYNTIFELGIDKCPSDLLSEGDVTAIFADFIIEGESFEVIDGDSMFMAKHWMKAITKAADKKMNNDRVASLSVLGLQSSGKSTMLNTMFGVHFSVSTGRCTKGINAQLLPVRSSGHNKAPFQYIMVVDSEGLRAPELDDIATKADRDNALATFVTGLGDLTLMNIMGENFADMKDILQIIVHALLRLKLANSAIRTGQACVFVHHNVTDKSARDNMKDGFLKLVNILDSVTVEAAKAEGISDIMRFSEVIKFDVDENVFHVPNLWQGIVPMNRVNTGYSDGVLSIKSRLIEIMSGVSCKSFSKLSDFIVNAEDLWKGILVENFVFSFRNSLEIKAYCSLEERMQKVIWDNEMNEKEHILNNMQKKFASCTNRATLKVEKEKLVTGFRKSIAKMKQQVINKVMELFEKNEHPEIVIKWKGAALININHRCEQLEISMRNEIDNAYQRCVIGIETASISREKTEKLRYESMVIAKRLQGQELDDKTIKMHFDNMWLSSMGQFEKENQSYTQEIDAIVTHNLYEIHKNDDTLLTNALKRVKFTSTHKLNFDGCGITEDDISLKSTWKVWQRTNMTKTMPIVKKEIEIFLTEGESMIERHMQSSKEISNIEIKKFVHSVWDSLTTLSARHDQQHFTLKKTALIKAHVHVCLYAWPLFKEHNEKYDKEHGTTAQLKKCKNDMFISFMDCINNRRSEETSAKFFCTGVERSLKKITETNVCMKVEQELRGKLPNLKHVLIKEICIDLANKNDFDQFISYLTNPEVFASSWFKAKGDKLLFSEKRYSSIAEDMISNMIDELERAVRNLKTRLQAPVNGSEIFNAVSEQLDKKLEIMEFVSFRTDDRRIEDIGYFTEILLGENGMFKRKIDSVRRHYKCITAKNVTWEMNPYENLLEIIWGCKETCPFCKEPCAKSSANHTNANHYCFQHRIQCCTSVRTTVSNEASLEVCNYDVQGDCTFNCSFIKGKCPSGTGVCGEHYFPFKEYRKYFPDWDIPPSTNAQDCSQFWLWFVNEHKQRLSAHFGYKIENVPSSWSIITKAQAIKSLDRYST